MGYIWPYVCVMYAEISVRRKVDLSLSVVKQGWWWNSNGSRFQKRLSSELHWLNINLHLEQGSKAMRAGRVLNDIQWSRTELEVAASHRSLHWCFKSPNRPVSRCVLWKCKEASSRQQILGPNNQKCPNTGENRSESCCQPLLQEVFFSSSYYLTLWLMLNLEK